MYFSSLEFDLRLPAQNSSRGTPHFVSSFFKECEVDTKLREFGLEVIEERKLVIEERNQSPLLWGISLKPLCFS